MVSIIFALCALALLPATVQSWKRPRNPRVLTAIALRVVGIVGFLVLAIATV